jgi:hypothetical protein
MNYLKKAIFWKLFKSSIGTVIAAILWQSFYLVPIPLILAASTFFVSFVAYLFLELYEEEKINTVFSFMDRNKGDWEYCQVPYKGVFVFGALLRNGTSVVNLAICVKPEMMGFVEKHEFLEMNGKIVATKNGSYIINANEKEITLSEIHKTN